MIFAVLLIIAATLLFGAAVVKGLIKDVLVMIIFAVVLLYMFGCVIRNNREAEEKAHHQADIAAEVPLTLKLVSEVSKYPVSRLIDAKQYDVAEYFMLCGSVANTEG